MFGRGGVVPAVMLALSILAIPVPVAANEVPSASVHDQIRVAKVAYRLAVANRAHCEAFLEPQPGFLVESRPGHPMTVTAMVPGSPAEEAGLATGDRLISVNRREPVNSGSDERSLKALQAAMRGGSTLLRVVGRHGLRDVQFIAESGCPARVDLVGDETVNAWADGTGIRITTGLLARCKNDDDLALVLGHELAHNLLRHGERLAGRSDAVSGLLPADEGALQEWQDSEEEADRFAVGLAMAARYDLTGAVAFMEGLLDRSIVDSTTHPGADRRLALLRDAIAEAMLDRARALVLLD